MAATPLALHDRDGESASLLVSTSSNSAFVCRSVGVIAIGLVNFLVLAALGAVFFVCIPIRTPVGMWALQFVYAAMNAMMMAFCILFSACLVLVKQNLPSRIVVGIVVLFFLAIVISLPGVGQSVQFEHFILFWMGVVIFIPLRAIGSWSIHWTEQDPSGRGTGQFSLADLLSWTTAIAVTIGFFRLVGAPRLATGFMFVAFSNAAGVTVYVIAVLGVLLVAGPCLWLAASRGRRLRGSLVIAGWIMATSLVWGATLMLLDFIYRFMPWWQVVLYTFLSLFYLLSLAVVLLANLFVLEWLGLRFTRSVPRADIAQAI